MNGSMDPLSLHEAKRQSATADTVLLRATRSADLETPIGAFLRLGEGVTAPRAVRSGGSRVHFLPPPLRFPPTTGSLCRRSTGTRPVHSPFFAMWPGVWAGRPEASSALAPFCASFSLKSAITTFAPSAAKV